jgi:hypothetical protein
MVAIDNDLFPAAELTGMARAEAEILDSSSLARWLPNVQTDDIAVSFSVTDDGTLSDEANYRAFDAEPDFGRGDEGGEELMIKLPAISKQLTISEYQQLRARNAGEAVLRNKIEQTMRNVVRSIVLRANSQRANVLVTGKATSTGKYRFNDDFGRDPALTTTAGASWASTSVSRLSALETLRDLYASKNDDQEPGAIVVTRTGWSALMRGDEFRPLLVNETTRPPTEGEVTGMLQAYGLPPVYRVQGIPDDTLLMLPAPGNPNAGEASELGATYWGRTLASSEPEWELAEEEQAGLICGVFTVKGVPPIKFVVGDSISLPVALNANRSLAATIL